MKQKNYSDIDMSDFLCYNVNMVTFDFECFAKLFSKLRLLVNASITFYNEEFQGTCACTSPGSPFCALIKKHLSEKCDESDSNSFMTCLNNNKQSLKYNCHFGLTELSFRLSHNNKTYGFVIVGPFKTKEDEGKIEKRISEYCNETGAPYDKMMRTFKDIPYFTEEKFNAIETLIYALFEYALSQKIILISQNNFIDIFDDYLQEHLSEDISIQSLCSHFYLSQKQFYTIIKNAKGIAPKAYIVQKRIMEAKYLIKTTDLPIQQIAEKVGMPDYPHFFKTFKSITGNSPNHYRKK